MPSFSKVIYKKLPLPGKCNKQCDDKKKTKKNLSVMYFLWHEDNKVY